MQKVINLMISLSIVFCFILFLFLDGCDRLTNILLLSFDTVFLSCTGQEIIFKNFS
jgi:hypothetical protein